MTDELTFHHAHLGGRAKWVRIDELDANEKMLALLEPGEVVTIKRRKFKVKSISIRPNGIILVPAEEFSR